MNESDYGYVFGVLFFKGSLIQSKKHGNYFISLKTRDRELAHNFLSKLVGIFKKNVKFHSRENFYEVLFYGKDKITNLLNSIKSRDVNRDEILKHALSDKNFRITFLQGLFDSKGSIRVRLRLRKDGKKQRCITIRIKSKDFARLKEIEKLLKLEGVQVNVYQLKDYSILEIDGKHRCMTFMKKINFTLTSKKGILKKALTIDGFNEIISSKQRIG